MIIKDNMKIICDTNIWYSIGNKKITKEQLKGLDLVATNINIIELCTTPNQ